MYIIVEKAIDFATKLGKKDTSQVQEKVKTKRTMLTKAPFVKLATTENIMDCATIETPIFDVMMQNIANNISFLKFIIWITGLIYLNSITRNHYTNSKVFNYLNDEIYKDMEYETEDTWENSLSTLRTIFEYFALITKLVTLFLMIPTIHMIYTKLSIGSFVEQNSEKIMDFHVIYQLTREIDGNDKYYHYKIGMSRWTNGADASSITFTFCEVNGKYKFLVENKEFNAGDTLYSEAEIISIINMIENKQYNKPLFELVTVHVYGAYPESTSPFQNDLDDNAFNRWGFFYNQIVAVKRACRGDRGFDIGHIYKGDLINDLNDDSGTLNPLF